jgi:flagellar assembly protein FliH
MPENVKVRVIDSNAVMAERMEKNRRMQPMQETSAEMPEGFVEGIAAGAVEPVMQAELAQEAREEADRILAEAKAQAQALVEEAREQADGIRSQAQQEGYQTGAAAKTQELEQMQERLQNEHRGRLQQLEQEYATKRESMEKDLVDAILLVVEKVFHVQFDGQKDMLLHLIDNAILHIEGEKHFRIKVAASNVAYLEEHKGDILDRVGHDVELDVAVDPAMGEDDCVIETDAGIFECSAGIQLDNLMKKIRCLCS